jgi:hypothetical protein
VPEELGEPGEAGPLAGAAAGVLEVLSLDFFPSVEAASEDVALVSDDPDSAGVELFAA